MSQVLEMIKQEIEINKLLFKELLFPVKSFLTKSENEIVEEYFNLIPEKGDGHIFSATKLP